MSRILGNLVPPDVPEPFEVKTGYEATPSSTVTLYGGMPIDEGYNHTIAFNNATEQMDYFSGYLPRYSITKAQYIRHTQNSIKVSANMNNIANYNYMSFINYDRDTTLGAEGKTYYAFITNVEYAGVSTCIVSYQIDVMQTFMFNFDFGDCFIERMHVPHSEDIPGKWRLDEGLPTGEYMTYTQIITEKCPYPAGKYCIAIFYADGDVQIANPVCSNVMSGIQVKTFDNASSAIIFIEQLTKDNKQDNIVTVLQLPYAMVYEPGGGKITQSWQDINVSQETITVDSEPYGTGYTAKVGGIVPKNRKLYTAPYYGLLGTSSSGESQTYAYEDFPKGDGATFRMTTCLSPTPAVSMTPLFYRGLPNNYGFELTCHDFPQCCYSTDGFKAWLAQNSNSIAANRNAAVTNRDLALATNAGSASSSWITSLLGMIPFIGGSSTGAYQAGAGRYQSPSYGGATNWAGIGKGIAGIAGAYMNKGYNEASILTDYALTNDAISARILDAAKLPDKGRGNAGSYLNYTRNAVGFMFYTYSVLPEYATLIDNYFSMYGYKVNIIGKPNIKTRSKWTYIKTAFCYLKNDNMPTVYSEKIRSIMNSGITFWRTPPDANGAHTWYQPFVGAYLDSAGNMKSNT